ncbi:MAG: fibronectin type III domain-containing protein [Clostridia bacterium]|nr:fibronectin type III domain-containing protein [Clostridia bacterium]
MKKCIMSVLTILALILCLGFATNAAYNDGDIIKAGDYPQTEVKDAKIVSALEKLPTEWKDMDESTKYADVVYNGGRYRALKLIKARPNTNNYTGYSPSNRIYWFKYEPIEWIVLDAEKGFCITRYIIDAQPFEPTVTETEEYDRWTSYMIYRNEKGGIANYFPDDSFIESWLEKVLEKDSGISNFEKSWDYICYRYEGIYYTMGNAWGPQLLNVENALKYLSDSESYPGSGLAVSGTDYAKALGLYCENGKAGWWLMDGGYYSAVACCVMTEGTISEMTYVNSGGRGIRPTVAFDFDEVHTHKYVGKVTKKATEKAQGEKKYECSECGEYYTEILPKLEHKTHTYKTTTTKATLKKNGKTVTKCTVCGQVKSTTTIYYPKTIKLSATTYTYNGKTQTPSVTVKDSKGKTLKKGTDYTVTYTKKRKAIGKYTVTVKFKGNYSGTKKLPLEIVPAKVTLSKLSAGSKQLTATWKTVSGATGYEVVYSTSKKFTKKTTKKVTIKKAKTKKTTIKKLKKGKKYYVKVRAYKTVDKTKIYGAYSAVKNIKVK